jgi:hypothetical protein
MIQKISVIFILSCSLGIASAATPHTAPQEISQEDISSELDQANPDQIIAALYKLIHLQLSKNSEAGYKILLQQEGILKKTLEQYYLAARDLQPIKKATINDIVTAAKNILDTIIKHKDALQQIDKNLTPSTAFQVIFNTHLMQIIFTLVTKEEDLLTLIEATKKLGGHLNPLFETASA